MKKEVGLPDFIKLEKDTLKFWDDNKIYLGNQLPKKGSDRCYGIAADEKYLMVCEYGCGGEAPEIVVLRRIRGIL